MTIDYKIVDALADAGITVEFHGDEPVPARVLEALGQTDA